jgi:uncharacterized protein YjbI with pentapeptide repeats
MATCSAGRQPVSCQFSDDYLAGVDLSEANLEQADLRAADLTNAILSGADLKGATSPIVSSGMPS